MATEPLCLRFVNTLADRPRGEQESLRRPADLIGWARSAGIIESRADSPEEGLLAESGSAQAAALFAAALELRECLFRLFSGASGGAEPRWPDVALLNRFVEPALRGACIAQARAPGDANAGPRFVWWYPQPNGLATVLAPIVRSAADLLVSAELDRVRECASPTCSWLFVDRSRPGRRRWCDMSSCGNRAKARRHYARRKAGARPAASG